MTALDAATQALVEQRSEAERQRESARRWCVHYEQVAAEYTRRVTIAAAFVADMACVCRGDSECWKCYLGRVLAGDE